MPSLSLTASSAGSISRRALATTSSSNSLPTAHAKTMPRFSSATTLDPGRSAPCSGGSAKPRSATTSNSIGPAPSTCSRRSMPLSSRRKCIRESCCRHEALPQLPPAMGRSLRLSDHPRAGHALRPPRLLSRNCIPRAPHASRQPPTVARPHMESRRRRRHLLSIPRFALHLALAQRRNDRPPPSASRPPIQPRHPAELLHLPRRIRRRSHRPHPRDRREARTTLNIGPNAKVIVYVGRLDLHKGLRELIDAVAQLIPHHPDLLCYMVGDGPDKPALLEAIARHDAASRIIFAPSCPTAQVALWMAAADLVTLPSYCLLY